jgi:diaphanous 1
MSDDVLIVPAVLPSGSLHFASIQQDGNVGDVINSLISLDEVKSDILGDLVPHGWAIQLVRKELPGRQWEQDELESLGDGTYLESRLVFHHLAVQLASGILNETARVAPLIQTPESDPSLQRHFSAFALTSHLHAPLLRLVSLHPSLSVAISFLRVPEIHDGFTWKCFFSRTTTVREVVDHVLETLGLTRSLPGPGGALVQYVLEEVWAEDDTESEPLISVLLITHQLEFMLTFFPRGCLAFLGRAPL